MIRYINKDLIFIDKHNQELEDFLDREHVRVPGLLQWRVKPKGLLSQAAEFVKTVTSGLASDETVSKRMASCLACPAMVRDAHGMHCAGCQCGRWTMARLDGSVLPKLRWAQLRCPMAKPGFSNHVPENENSR